MKVKKEDKLMGKEIKIIESEILGLEYEKFVNEYYSNFKDDKDLNLTNFLLYKILKQLERRK